MSIPARVQCFPVPTDSTKDCQFLGLAIEERISIGLHIGPLVKKNGNFRVILKSCNYHLLENILLKVKPVLYP